MESQKKASRKRSCLKSRKPPVRRVQGETGGGRGQRRSLKGSSMADMAEAERDSGGLAEKLVDLITQREDGVVDLDRANENAAASLQTAEIRERIGEAPQEDSRNQCPNIRTDGLNAADPDHFEALQETWAKHARDFEFLDDLRLDLLPEYSTPPAQPPQSATMMPSPSDTKIDLYCWESMLCASTPQSQTMPPISTATPSVLNRPITDIHRYDLEMIHKDYAILSTSMPQAQTPPINTAMPSIPNTKTDIGWSSKKMIHNDNSRPGISTAQAQPQPPIDTAMPSVCNTIANIVWDSSKMIREDNVTDSSNASQAQTRPQINTAMPSVPDMDWDSMEMTHEYNVLANICASQAQTPPPVNAAIPIVSNMTANTESGSLDIIHEDNTMTGTNTTQDQTTQSTVAAMCCASKTTRSKNESVTRSMSEVNSNSETAAVTPVVRKRKPISNVYRRSPKLLRHK